ELVCALAAGNNPIASPLARSFLIAHLQAFLRFGLLDSLQSGLSLDMLPTDELPRVIQQVQRFLDFERGLVDGNRLRQDYVDRVRGWLVDLTPVDLNRRLIAVVGQDPWDIVVRGSDSERDQELRTLAQSLLDHPAELEASIEWLCSPAAHSAF